MEDPNTDSQDSDASNTSSWIILSNDEEMQTLTSIEKSNQSDIESDGFSIISEGEFSSYDRSDDDTAMDYVSENFEKNENRGESDVEEPLGDTEEMEHEHIDILENIEDFIMNSEKFKLKLQDGKISDTEESTETTYNSEKYESAEEKLEQNYGMPQISTIGVCKEFECERDITLKNILPEVEPHDLSSSTSETEEKTYKDLIEEPEINDERIIIQQFLQGNFEDTIVAAYATDVNNSTTEDVAGDIFSDEIIEKHSTATAISNCLNNFNHIYDFKKILTCPSVLCTSVVIFAVLVFPYFSSKIYSTDGLDQPDMNQYDSHSLPDKKLTDVDPVLYCKEVHENDDLYHDYNIKRCVKKVLKLIKKAKQNQNARKDHFLHKEINKRKNKKYVDDQETEIFKYMNKKINNGLKDMKYTNVNTNTKSSQIKQDDSETDEMLHSEMNWSFPEAEMHLNENDVNIQRKNYDYKDIHNERNIGKHWGYFSKTNLRELNNGETFDKYFEKKEFNKKKKFLLEKENMLRDWEKKLNEREKRIEEEEKKLRFSKEDINFSKSGKYGKVKKSKGDFDDDESSYERTFKKNNKKKATINFVYNAKEYENHSKKNKHDKNNRESAKIKKNNEDIVQHETFRKVKENKGASSHFETYNEKSLNDINTNTVHNNNSKYLKVQDIPKKNRTQILADDNITMTGEWYLNLISGRQEIRRKEEKAVWWFDRAEFRRNKRNKAYWYFQYMFNRENLRYRPKNI